MKRKVLNRKKIDPYEMVFTGEKKEDKIEIQLFSYNDNDYEEDNRFNIDTLKKFPEDNTQYWLNLHGIHHAEVINNLCEKQNIHPLVIQDILDTNQRPKFQDFDDYWFFTIKSVLPEHQFEVESEQLSFILGKNYLISFQERKADYFDHIRHRLRNHVGKIRERSVDYLLYLLLEAILDNYFKTINEIALNIDKMGVFDFDRNSSPQSLKSIEEFKRSIHHIKKTIVPIKEFILRLEHEEFGMIKREYIKYFYELKDLCLSLIDECDSINIKLESQINLFFSIQGHQMNQIMKTLTVVATIFIPLTFLAGIYGMNFENMPELKWEYGYVGIWMIMVLLALVMIVFIKKKKW